MRVVISYQCVSCSLLTSCSTSKHYYAHLIQRELISGNHRTEEENGLGAGGDGVMK